LPLPNDRIRPLLIVNGYCKEETTTKRLTNRGHEGEVRRERVFILVCVPEPKGEREGRRSREVAL